MGRGSHRHYWRESKKPKQTHQDKYKKTGPDENEDWEGKLFTELWLPRPSKKSKRHNSYSANIQQVAIEVFGGTYYCVGDEHAQANVPES